VNEYTAKFQAERSSVGRIKFVLLLFTSSSLACTEREIVFIFMKTELILKSYLFLVFPHTSKVFSLNICHQRSLFAWYSVVV